MGNVTLFVVFHRTVGKVEYQVHNLRIKPFLEHGERLGRPPIGFDLPPTGQLFFEDWLKPSP